MILGLTYNMSIKDLRRWESLNLKSSFFRYKSVQKYHQIENDNGMNH